MTNGRGCVKAESRRGALPPTLSSFWCALLSPAVADTNPAAQWRQSGVARVALTWPCRGCYVKNSTARYVAEKKWTKGTTVDILYTQKRKRTPERLGEHPNACTLKRTALAAQGGAPRDHSRSSSTG